MIVKFKTKQMRKKKDFRIKRNKRLKLFFETIFPNQDIKVIGNINTPAVILNDKTVLSCYAHNFDLIFTNQNSNGEIVHTEKLTYDINYDSEAISKWFVEAEHLECFTISFGQTSLKLSGYNFLDKENIKEDSDNIGNRYPVFSRFDYKIYFSKESAEHIIDLYPEYNLILN